MIMLSKLEPRKEFEAYRVSLNYKMLSCLLI